MQQSITALTPELAAHGEKQRDWIKGHFSEKADEKYAPLEGKLRLLKAIIDNKWIEPHETWKLQALGIALGDAFSQELGLEWVTVSDEHGTDPALRYSGTSIVVFPLTMISKRIENGESVDVIRLFFEFCAVIRERIDAETG
ncbi:MAG: DUF3806 domain-containing protein [Proteobacteria bacterium]|nr:DUF3806 domain-containing protein [Pseudomonadota bacterium]